VPQDYYNSNNKEKNNELENLPLLIDQPSTSTVSLNESSSDSTLQLHQPSISAVSFNEYLSSNLRINSHTDDITTFPIITSFEQLLLQTCKQTIPVNGPQKRKRIAGGAEVLTANDYLDKLIANQLEKEEIEKV